MFEIADQDIETTQRELILLIVPVVENYQRRHERKAQRASHEGNRQFHKAKSDFAIEWLSRAKRITA